MGHSILASLGHEPGSSPTNDALDSHCVASVILGLANDIQAILGDALATAAPMFPHKPSATLGKGTLPRHLWPKSVCHDLSNIRRHGGLTADLSLPLWSSVNTPLSLRTILNPPIKDQDSLGVVMKPDPTPTGTTTLKA